MKKILIVCLGNICRSPTAEAVLKAKALQRGSQFEIDSAGTAGYHIGNPPDKRSQAAALKRGYSFEGIRSRQAYGTCVDEIPDPYYGGENGFEQVLDLIEDASDKILDTLQK